MEALDHLEDKASPKRHRSYPAARLQRRLGRDPLAVTGCPLVRGFSVVFVGPVLSMLLASMKSAHERTAAHATRASVLAAPGIRAPRLAFPGRCVRLGGPLGGPGLGNSAARARTVGARRSWARDRYGVGWVSPDIAALRAARSPNNLARSPASSLYADARHDPVETDGRTLPARALLLRRPCIVSMCQRRFERATWATLEARSRCSPCLG